MTMSRTFALCLLAEALSIWSGQAQDAAPTSAKASPAVAYVYVARPHPP